MGGAPIWAISLPLGFIYTFVPRAVSGLLQTKYGVPLRNEDPRGQPNSREVEVVDTEGYVRRAYAAHQNSWEAMIVWTAAVLLARTTGVEESTMNSWATVWIIARLAYVPAYILIKTRVASYIRSVLFMVATVASFSLMITGASNA